jgi:hypothetical protein
LKDFKIWKTAEDGCKKRIPATVEEVYMNKLKDGTTIFHKVFARYLLEHLKKNSTGLHDLNIIALRLNKLLLYKNAASMPDFILAMEEVQKKAKRTELPILTSNWPCTPPPPCSNWATTKRKQMNWKDAMLP